MFNKTSDPIFHIFAQISILAIQVISTMSIFHMLYYYYVNRMYSSKKSKVQQLMPTMAELKVLIRESWYDDNMQTILLKDQFIFGVTVHEKEEHMLN